MRGADVIKVLWLTFISSWTLGAYPWNSVFVLPAMNNLVFHTGNCGLFAIQGLPGPPGDIGPEGLIGRKVGTGFFFLKLNLNLSNLASVKVQKDQHYFYLVTCSPKPNVCIEECSVLSFVVFILVYFSIQISRSININCPHRNMTNVKCNKSSRCVTSSTNAWGDQTLERLFSVTAETF